VHDRNAKSGGADIPEVKRLRQLEDKNTKLKNLLAEHIPDAAALRELPSKNDRPTSFKTYS
jgi:putative transposase